MKYVKLDDVITQIDKAEIDANWDNEVFNAEYVIETLDSIPYVENVQPAIKAHWIELEGHKHKCSHCGFITNPWVVTFYNFCPICGADMRIEKSTNCQECSV